MARSVANTVPQWRVCKRMMTGEPTAAAMFALTLSEHVLACVTSLLDCMFSSPIYLMVTRSQAARKGLLYVCTQQPDGKANPLEASDLCSSKATP